VVGVAQHGFPAQGSMVQGSMVQGSMVQGSVVQLKTLGVLSLEPSTFTRPKPLLLLTYLALEGSQGRRHLAELFWQAGNRMKSLSMALTLLRQGAGEVVRVDAKKVEAAVKSDVRELLTALDQSNWAEAARLYTAPFLEGVILEDHNTELEEWIYKTREYLAERVQYALLNLAEEAAKQQNFQAASELAERAYKLPGLAGTDITHLKRLYTLLCAAGSLLAPEVRKEAESYDLELRLTTEEARAMFKREAKPMAPLPMRGTSFVGRDEELTELATLLTERNVSLLTLLGTAGVGKTRLALQLAFEQQKLRTFKDGVYFVPLESLTEASQLPNGLLDHFGLSQGGKTETLRQLADFLSPKNLLLILDNFEHLNEGAGFLSELLRKCPQLKMLVTSREILKLEEENVFALGGLPFPQKATDKILTNNIFSDAVQLFKERAQQVQPHFDLEQHLADVIRICRLVEGLPLGLELAASWVRFMSCAEIANEIENNLELLTTHVQNVPERHRSLRAAFEYSWKLLTTKEQGTLKKLSVFRDGFRREAASEVAGATIPVLASLVDKSLIRVLPTGRYDCHPLLCQYAREKLAANPDEEQSVKAEHVRYYLALLTEQERAITRGGQKEVLRVFQEERGNIELVLAWGLRHLELADLLRWLELMDAYYDSRGAYQDALEFLSRAEAVLDKNNRNERGVLGRVLVEKAWYILRLGQYHEARRVVAEGLGMLPQSANPEWLVTAHNTSGILARRTGEGEAAKGHFEIALRLARESKDELLIAKALASLADEEDKLGNYEVSENYFLEAITLYQKLGLAIGAIRNLNNLGFHYYTRGDNAKAKPIFEEGLRLAREIEFKQTIPYFLNNLGYIAFDAGDYQTSLELNLEALALSKETAEKAVQAEILAALSRAATALGEVEAAWQYSRDGVQLAHAVGFTLVLLQGLFARAELYGVLGRLEDAGKLLFVILRHPAATDIEKNPARKLLAMLQTKLSTKQMLALETLASRLSLEGCVAEVLNDTQMPTLVSA
jgi:predicted ATPase